MISSSVAYLFFFFLIFLLIFFRFIKIYNFFVPGCVSGFRKGWGGEKGSREARREKWMNVREGERGEEGKKERQSKGGRNGEIDIPAAERERVDSNTFFCKKLRE